MRRPTWESVLTSIDLSPALYSQKVTSQIPSVFTCNQVKWNLHLWGLQINVCLKFSITFYKPFKKVSHKAKSILLQEKLDQLPANQLHQNSIKDCFKTFFYFRKRHCFFSVRDPPEPVRNDFIGNFSERRTAQPGRQLRREHHHRPVWPARSRSLGSGSNEIILFLITNNFLAYFKPPKNCHWNMLQEQIN